MPKQNLPPARRTHGWQVKIIGIDASANRRSVTGIGRITDMIG